jgi:hypothetical protein
MFHTERELPERIKGLLFGKNGRCPMDTFSPKCLFCPAANHPFSPFGEKGHSTDRTGRKCLISRPFDREVCWIRTYWSQCSEVSAGWFWARRGSNHRAACLLHQQNVQHRIRLCNEVVARGNAANTANFTDHNRVEHSRQNRPILILKSRLKSAIPV